MIVPDLFQVAYIPDWFGQLATLAQMALPEGWTWRYLKTNAQEKNPDTPILANYINYTFRKLVIDYNNAPAEDAKKYLYATSEIMVFNTGLFSRNYKPLYGVLHRNTRPDSPRDWFFKGFSDDGGSYLRYISPLPEKPEYIAEQKICVYDYTLPIRVNVAHILGDAENISRLPEELQNAPNLPLLLETAVELGRRKAAVEHGTVVPQGYQGKMQFLMPLCLTNMEFPDAALTLEPLEGYYHGSTVLTLEMAYTNARAITKPSASWLTDMVI